MRYLTKYSSWLITLNKFHSYDESAFNANPLVFLVYTRFKSRSIERTWINSSTEILKNNNRMINVEAIISKYFEII